jgi:NADH-quinone oxidoreductase subunit H
MAALSNLAHIIWNFIAQYEVLRSFVVAVLSLVFMLVIVLFVIWMERKVSADIQNRIGPIRTGGVLGFLLQSMADALKLLLKEDLRPTGADKWPFYVAPYLVFVPAFMVYLILPFSATWVPQDLKIGILFYSAVSAVPALGIAMAGWSSNNKWSLLGGLRAAAQLISYELPLGLAILAVVLLNGTLDMKQLVAAQWQHPWLNLVTLPSLAIFIMAGMAEVSRTPFDLPEAESELVSGFNTEYSGMRFATFFLAEFSASFFIAALAVTLFVGGWSLWGIDIWFAKTFLHMNPSTWDITQPASIPFIMKAFWFVVFLVKTVAMLWVFMWIKWTMPRLRIDQVLNFGWKILLPVALLNLLLVSGVGAVLPHLTATRTATKDVAPIHIDDNLGLTTREPAPELELTPPPLKKSMPPQGMPLEAEPVEDAPAAPEAKPAGTP